VTTELFLEKSETLLYGKMIKEGLTSIAEVAMCVRNGTPYLKITLSSNNV
jgi:hypothetical protein